MRNKFFSSLLLCIGLCALVNVSYAQDGDEQTTTEKQAFALQSAEPSPVIFVLEAPKTAAAYYLATNNDAAFALVHNAPLQPAALCGFSCSYLEAHFFRLCESKQPLYNQYAFIKERFTGQWYHYVFS